MATVKTKQMKKIVLTLSQREAEALTELLTLVDESQGEGEQLGNLYVALLSEDCESFATHSDVKDDQVIITREEE